MMETPLQTLRGHIGDLKRSRRTRDFVLGRIGDRQVRDASMNPEDLRQKPASRSPADGVLR